MSGGTNVWGDKCLGGQMSSGGQMLGGQLIWTWSLPTTMTSCRVGRGRVLIVRIQYMYNTVHTIIVQITDMIIAKLSSG